MFTVLWGKKTSMLVVFGGKYDFADFSFWKKMVIIMVAGLHAVVW